MHASKHALLADLSTASRSALHRAAAAHRVGVDELVQTILGRTVHCLPDDAERLRDAVANLDREVGIEVQTVLAASWPEPPAPPVLSVVEWRDPSPVPADEFLAAPEASPAS